MSELTPNSTAHSTDQVFHITHPHRVESIGNIGLHADPERGIDKTWRQAEELIDEARPQEIIDMHISRAQGVFAHPNLEAIGPRSMGGIKFINETHPAILGVEVNPDDVLVADASYTEDVVRIIDEGLRTGTTYDRASAEQYAHQYWDHAMTLSSFRRDYEVTVTPHGPIYARSDKAANTLPAHLLRPEVIIPGPVEPDHIEHTASILPRPIR